MSLMFALGHKGVVIHDLLGSNDSLHPFLGTQIMKDTLSEFCD